MCDFQKFSVHHKLKLVNCIFLPLKWKKVLGENVTIEKEIVILMVSK